MSISSSGLDPWSLSIVRTFAAMGVLVAVGLAFSLVVVLLRGVGLGKAGLDFFAGAFFDGVVVGGL